MVTDVTPSKDDDQKLAGTIHGLVHDLNEAIRKATAEGLRVEIHVDEPQPISAASAYKPYPGMMLDCATVNAEISRPIRKRD